MSDQTEKSKGTHPKGYEPNAHGKPQDQDKKIWDKYYNGEIELPDVVKELKHFRSSEDTEPETSDEDHDAVLKAWKRTQNIYGYSRQKAKPKQGTEKELEEYEKKYLARYKQPKAKPKKLSNLKPDIDIGRLNIRKHAVTKRREYLAERKEYEKKYLARYKQPKAKPKKLSNLKSSSDLGRLNFRKHAVIKRREYLANRKDYEEKYIQRYMVKREAKPKKSSSKKLDHDLISGRLNLREQIEKKRKELQVERKAYEKKYLVRYKERKPKTTKSSSLKSDDDLGRLNLRKHAVTKQKEYLAKRKEYEKEYLARYNKQQKTKPKKKVVSSNLYKPEEPKPKQDMKKERMEYERKYLARYQKQQKTKRSKKK